MVDDILMIFREAVFSAAIGPRSMTLGNDAVTATFCDVGNYSLFACNCCMYSYDGK